MAMQGGRLRALSGRLFRNGLHTHRAAIGQLGPPRGTGVGGGGEEKKQLDDDASVVSRGEHLSLWKPKKYLKKEREV